MSEQRATEGTSQAGDAELGHADFNQPNIARIYDYFLDGSAHFAVDRAAADELEQAFPDERAYCHANRAFLGRVVRTLIRDYGLDQFLDLGSGVPTRGNVHEIAHRWNPHARIAYADWEAIAVHHARRLLHEQEGRVTVTEADVCQPETVLTAPGVADLLDFTRPVAVLALGILDIIPHADGAGLIAHYRDACSAGSALAVSNDAQLTQTDADVATRLAIFARTSTPTVHLRDREQVAALLPGYQLMAPGVVPTAAWQPDQPVTDTEAARSNAYAAVGILP